MITFTCYCFIEENKMEDVSDFFFFFFFSFALREH